MAKDKTAVFGNFTGYGKTEPQARADAINKAEEGLRGHYSPALVTVEGEQAMVCRDPWTGWYWTPIHRAPEGVQGGMAHNGRGPYQSQTREEVIQDAMDALAQTAFTRSDEGITFEHASRIARLMQDNHCKAEFFLRWAIWQIRYARWFATGLDNNESRRRADLEQDPPEWDPTPALAEVR